MKKLLLMVAFLLPMMANAQLGSLVEQPLNGYESSIVRIWQGHDKVLSYGHIMSGTNTKPVFYLSDYSSFFSPTPPTPTLSMQYAELSATWGSTDIRFTDIRDMRIVDDYVFVCGDAYDTNSPQTKINAIGWFDLNDFASGNIVFNYIDIPLVWYLKKIAAYQCGLDYTVLVIGEDQSSYDYIFEIRNVTTNTPAFYCRRFTSSSFWDKEAADDILVTGREVFVVGNLRTPPSDRQLCIRKADRTQVLSDPQFDIRYEYTAASDEVNANTYSTLIDEEFIATTYVHHTNPDGFSTRLRIINTQTLDMVNSQEWTIDSKWEPEEMVYENAPKKLVLLHAFGNDWNFLVLDPMNTVSYVADYLFHPNAEFYSLDSDQRDLFVSTGAKHWLYFQRLGMTLPSPSGCPNNSKIEVNAIKNVPTSTVPNTPINQPISPQRRFGLMPASGIPPVTICNSPF
ncbi:MAG: hypothetical protein IJQ14_07070 [Bacteroidales bacterium]|nr:hypothetical protein [Bacteroidales bacterium]